MRARIFTLVSPIVSLVLVLGTLGVLAQGSQTGARREQAMAQQQTQNVTLVGQIGGGMRAVAHQGNYAYVGVGPRLVVLDVSDPPLPAIVGQTGVLPALVWGVAVVGNYAYVADGEAGLHIIDVSDPATPGEAGFYDTPGWAGDVAVAGDYAYVADGDSGLRIIDVADPAAPSETGFYDTPGEAENVAVAGGYAYVADGDSGLRIIDVSNPAAPREAGFYDTPGGAVGMAVAGDPSTGSRQVYAYVADWDGGLVILRFLPPLLLDKQATPRDGLRNNDTLTYTLTLSSPGLGVRLWDPLPAAVQYISDSITSTIAPPAVYSLTAHAVVWEGTLPTDTAQVIRFQVTITGGGPLSSSLPIVNTAWLTDTEYGRSVSATVIVNGWHAYLPLVVRNASIR